MKSIEDFHKRNRKDKNSVDKEFEDQKHLCTFKPVINRNIKVARYSPPK